MAEKVGAPGVNILFNAARQFINETLAPDRWQYSVRGMVGVGRGWLGSAPVWLQSVGGVALDLADGKSAVIGKALSDVTLAGALRLLDGKDSPRGLAPPEPWRDRLSSLMADDSPLPVEDREAVCAALVRLDLYERELEQLQAEHPPGGR